jgi:hypothetical protein
MALAATTACATVPSPEGLVTLSPGQRVRATLSSRVARAALQGTAISVTADTLTVEREEGGLRSLSRDQVERVDVSVGKERDPVKAARYGILAGAPLIVLAILFAPIASEDSPTGIGIVLIPVAALAAVGAAMGSGKQDVWVEASWPAQDIGPPDSIGAESE